MFILPLVKKSPIVPRGFVGITHFALAIACAVSLLTSCKRKQTPANEREQPAASAVGSKPVAPPSRPKPPAPRSWAIPSAAADNAKKENFNIVGLFINETGTMAITKSKREIHCFDLVNGRLVRTFLPPKPRWDYMEPETHSMYPSQNARFIATISESHSTAKDHEKTLTIQDAETEAVLATHPLNLDERYSPESIGFDFEESALLLPTEINDKMALQVIPASRQEVQIMDWSFLKAGSLRKLLPVPADSIVIALWQHPRAKPHASRLSAINLSAGTERLIQSVTFEPLCSPHDCGVTLSPDGRWLLARSGNKIQICDWRADQILFERSEFDIGYSRVRFTPDGQRFLVQRTPHYELMQIGGVNGGKREKVPTTIELYDIASQKKISDYTPVGAVGALILSHDGKTIFYARGTTLYAIEFKAAFGIDP